MKIAINIHPLKSGHKDRGIGFYTANLLDNLKKYTRLEIQEFINISEVKDASLIHYPWFDFFFHTLFINKPLPTVVTIHDTIPLKFKEHYKTGLKGKFNLYLQKLSLRKCTAFITDSQTSKNDINKYLKINNEDITTIPLAADSDFEILPMASLIRIKRKYNLPEQFLLYVGDANWIKNLPFLIEGFKKLIIDTKFENLKLVLIGGAFLKNVDNIDHPELQSLKQVNRLIKDYNLENKVIKLGQLDKSELVAFYNLTTIYIQPSIYEGFGLPLLEAMSCGAPVASSDGGSLKEVGANAAVYFDPTNLNQFTSIVAEILENKSLRDKLSKLGLRQAEKFSWKKVIQQTEQVYTQALQIKSK